MIGQLYKKNLSEYRTIVRWFGVSENYIDDVINDFFINLLEKKNLQKVIIDGEINPGYSYIALRNLSFKHHKIEKRYTTIDEKQKQKDDNLVLIDESIFLDLRNITENDKILFLKYINEGYSLRQLAKKECISLHMTFKAIKNIKNKLKNKRLWKQENFTTNELKKNQLLEVSN